jgi:hypothetical protein
MRKAILFTANAPQIAQAWLMLDSFRDPGRGAFDGDIWVLSTDLDDAARAYLDNIGVRYFVDPLDWTEHEMDWRNCVPPAPEAEARAAFEVYRNKRMSKLAYVGWHAAHGADYDAVAVCDNDLYAQKPLGPVFDVVANGCINYWREDYPMLPGTSLWRKDFRYRQITGQWGYDPGLYEVNIGFIVARPDVIHDLFATLRARFPDLPARLIRDDRWHDQDLTRVLRWQRPELFALFPEDTILHLCGGGMALVENARRACSTIASPARCPRSSISAAGSGGTSRPSRMITPVLLCGGSGTRLWPLSRKSYPKQFADVVGDESLFQASARRFTGRALPAAGGHRRSLPLHRDRAAGRDRHPAGWHPDRARGPQHRARRRRRRAVRHGAGSRGADPAGALGPRHPRCPSVPRAVLAGRTRRRGRADRDLRHRADAGGDRLWLARDRRRGQRRAARSNASSKSPTPPPPSAACRQPLPVERGRLPGPGRRAGRAFKAHAPEILDRVAAAHAGRAERSGLYPARPRRSGPRCRRTRSTYAVMEKADNLSAVRFDGGWTDLGGWESVWLESGRDAAGNAVTDHATAIDCENTLLRAETRTRSWSASG